MSFADALDRETAWLATSPRADGLPDLTARFDVIQARQPRTPRTKQPQLYVLHQPDDSSHIERTTNQRAMFTHQLMVRMVWPITAASGHAEDDQLAFDQAIDDVVTVVMGLVGDHTHGGRFLSVAEDPDRIRVNLADPAAALVGSGQREYRATVLYSADDYETTN